MGSRAHYVLIKDRQLNIFYSHRGALAIPAVIASGPEATLAYIRELEPAQGLIGMLALIEGGIFLDVDAHSVLFWGGDAIAGHPYLRRPLLAALPWLWPGWSIHWATYGIADLRRAMNRKASQTLDDDIDDIAFLVGNEATVTEAHLLQSLKTQGPGTLLTLRWKTGEVRDYFFLAGTPRLRDKYGNYPFSATPYEILSLSSPLLTLMLTQPTASLPREGDPQEPDEGALVDEETHSIWVWQNDTLDPRYLEAIARRWPGWQVQGHVEGMVRQVILSGRDPTTLMIPHQQAIDELIEELMQQPGIDLRRVSRAIQQTFPVE
ncbi:MAG TPA: hypothetical protein VKR06_09630 [Ktedonosporobacter sp.]|nr:hypothetical protein [Ktedonosporobacter sp.]